MLQTRSADPAAASGLPGAAETTGVRGLVASAGQIPYAAAAAYVEAMRAARPHAAPADIVYLLQRRYQFTLSVGGVATGLTALRPLGTAAATGLTAAHLTGAAGLSSLYLLALARVYGIDDPASVQHLLSSCALGATDTSLLEFQSGLGPNSWYAATLARLPVGHVRWTRRLADRQLAALARTGGVSRSASVLPFGIGSTLGFVSGRILAARVIDAAHHHLGAPPATFAPQVPSLYTEYPDRHVDTAPVSKEN